MIRGWWLHWTRPHHASMRDAHYMLALARMAGYPMRRIDSCRCGKYLVHVSKEAAR